ncbi:hypothetical protein M405DRAFT_614679 [Rhizopogon salebrosus TDB-379]|nr:hypothetical protein M405DRAFT_614679 [Rhizopogon salebrosus TDB-379]
MLTILLTWPMQVLPCYHCFPLPDLDASLHSCYYFGDPRFTRVGAAIGTGPPLRGRLPLSYLHLVNANILSSNAGLSVRKVILCAFRYAKCLQLEVHSFCLANRQSLFRVDHCLTSLLSHHSTYHSPISIPLQRFHIVLRPLCIVMQSPCLCQRH